MHIFIVLLGFLLSLNTFSSVEGQVNSFSFVGVAYDVESNSVLYKELHTVILNAQQEYEKTLVEYTDVEGNVFAKKRLYFNHNLMAPDVYFVDNRASTLVEVETKTDTLIVNYEGRLDDASARIKAVSMMVVDAGFDQMLIQYWDKLLDNQPLDFEFLAPTRAELISFSLTPVYQDNQVIKFELAPSNFILSLLFDAIKLTYDKSSKRILVYEGLTNIEEFKPGKQTGDYYVARIEYRY